MARCVGASADGSHAVFAILLRKMETLHAGMETLHAGMETLHAGMETLRRGIKTLRAGMETLLIWSAPAERSGDGALDFLRESWIPTQIQSGVVAAALQIAKAASPPHSELVARL